MTDIICPIMSASGYVSKCNTNCRFYHNIRGCWLLTLAIAVEHLAFGDEKE